MAYEEMAKKAEFMQDFIIDSEGSPESAMGLNLARTVMNEGMSLFSAFVQLLNYQRPAAGSKMLGTGEIVEWSIRDETKHVEIMSELFRKHCAENPEIVTDAFKLAIYSMYRQGVELEDKLIDLSYSMGESATLTKVDIKQYIRLIADRQLVRLGLKPNWDVQENPLPWVDHIISGDNQKNFFEGRVTDYNHKGMTGDWGW